MSVVLSVEELGPCQHKVEIAGPAAAGEAEYARAVADTARKVRLPGFRKGKVPANLIERQFREEIEHQLVERLVPRYWKQAAAERQIDPLSPPEIAGVEVAKGSPLRFTATVETRPAIELGNVTEFDLPAPPVEPAPDEVERALDALGLERADWLPAERPAANGDRAKLSIVEDDDADGAKPPQQIEIEIGSPQVWEELSLSVVGAEAGQERDFARREGEGEEARTRRFRVTVVEVRRPELPPLDDALAAKLGRFASVEELRSGVTASLRAARARERRRQREQAAVEQLLARHSFPVPAGVVKHETEHLLEEYAEGLARRGVDLRKSQIDWSKLGEQLRPQAERRVRARLMLDAVAKSRDLEIEEPEFERALAEMARAQNRSTLAVRQNLDERGQLGELRRQLLRDKTLSALLGESAGPAASETTG